MAVKRTKHGWRVDYRDKDGKRYRKTFRLKKAAGNFLDDERQKIKAGTFIAPAKIPTLAEVAEEWLTSKAHLRPSTVAFYRIELDTHLLPALGTHRLNAIDVAMIERLRNERRAAGLSTGTVNALLTRLAAIFAYAQRRQLCTGNPATLVERLKRDTAALDDDEAVSHRTGAAVNPDEVPSHAEVRTLLDKAEPGFYRTLFLTAAMTGARHDELLALRWSDVTLDAKGKETIAIRRSLLWSTPKGEKPRPQFFPPKTTAGRRSIPIPPPLVHALKVWKLQCPNDPTGQHDLVFPTEHGTPVHRSNVLRCGLYPTLERAEVRRFTMHALRHFFASALIADGRPVTEVQHLLGHSSPMTTLSVYAHWFRTSETPAIANLAKVLCG